jgi:hypothetical protein
MQRRSFLKGAGALRTCRWRGVWRAYGQGVFSIGEGPAHEPWKDWRTNSPDSAGAGARCNSRRQPARQLPWLFRVTPSRIELYLDTTRNVGALDPCGRNTSGLAAPGEPDVGAAASGSPATLTLVSGKLQPAPMGSKLVARVDLVRAHASRTALRYDPPASHESQSLPATETDSVSLMDELAAWKRRTGVNFPALLPQTERSSRK